MSDQARETAFKTFHDSDLAGPLYLTVGFTALQLAVTQLQPPWWPLAQRFFGLLGAIALVAAVWFTVTAAQNLRKRLHEKQFKDQMIQAGFDKQLKHLQDLERGISSSADILRGMQGQVESVAKSAAELSELIVHIRSSVQEVDEGIHRHIRNSNFLTGNNFSEVLDRLSRMDGQLHKVSEMAALVPPPEPTLIPGTPATPLDPVPYALYRIYSALAQKHQGVVYLSTFFNTVAALDRLLDWKVSGKDNWVFDGFAEDKPRSRWKDPRAKNLEAFFQMEPTKKGLLGWKGEIPPRETALPGFDGRLEEALSVADFGSDHSKMNIFRELLDQEANLPALATTR